MSEAEWCTISSSRGGTTWLYASFRPGAPRLYGSEVIRETDRRATSPAVCRLLPLPPPLPPLAEPAAGLAAERDGLPVAIAPLEPSLPLPLAASVASGCTCMQLFTLPKLSRTVGAVWS